MKVLITGVTGTLGKELLKRALADSDVSCVIGLSRDEQKQRLLPKHNKLIPVLGDIRDQDALGRLFSRYDPKRVYHTAALKCVDSLEENPTEAVKTNLWGTENLIDVCELTKAELVLTSTDKACYPVNIYGVTKAAAERLALKAGHRVCRYGNVIGSRGSVLEPFYKALTLTKEKKVLITHPEMTRFWISIESVADFVYLSVEKPPGLKIPEMKAAPVTLLAGAIAKLAGVASFSTEVIGVRPGEKIHECLKTAEEGGPIYSSDPDRQFSLDDLAELIAPTLWELRCQF